MKKVTFMTKKHIIPLIITLFCLNACTATLHFKTIDPPPPTSKLRIALVPIMGNPGKYGWSMTYEEWSNWLSKNINERLLDMGIYEVVPRKDVNDALGTQTLNIRDFWWLENDYSLLRQYGKALYADYVMFIKADAATSMYYSFETIFINNETGKRYTVSDGVQNQGSYEKTGEIITNDMFPRMSKKLNSEVKGDLLATAMRKGRLKKPLEETKKPIPSKTDLTLEPPSPPVTIDKTTPPANLPIVTQRDEFGKGRDNELNNKTSIQNKTRLVVYDLNANEQYKVVSLILTNALREELFKLGIFSLVNREDVAQVMQEFRLQQSGLADENQFLKIGKWLIANEAVTGLFAQFGNSYILQVKRIDVTTMSNLGFGTIKCTTGKEEELLAGLPELARRIAGLVK